MSEKREAWHYDATEGRPLWSKAFPTWKFKVIGAMLADARLLASDFRVGVALLQHLGSVSGPVFPSQETLADLTHMSRRNVKSCLDRLRSAGWIRWARGNRQLSNQYEFDVEAADVQIDRVRAAEKERRQKRKTARSDVKPTAHQKPILMRSAVHVATCSPVHTNNLSEGGTRDKQMTGKGRA